MKPIYYQVKSEIETWMGSYVGATVLSATEPHTAALADLLLERFNITPKED